MTVTVTGTVIGALVTVLVLERLQVVPIFDHVSVTVHISVTVTVAVTLIRIGPGRRGAPGTRTPPLQHLASVS